MHLLTCLSPFDGCLDSAFTLFDTAASNLGTSAAATSASSSEAHMEEHVGDFKGEYGLDYWNRRRRAWISGRPVQVASSSQSLQEQGTISVSSGVANPPRNGTP